MTVPTHAGDATEAEIAALLHPALVRLVRLVRNQRVDQSVTITQLSAMGSLSKHGPMSAGELAAYERVQPPSMTKVLASLEDRGLVRRDAHPDDRRQAVIQITEQGSALLAEERRSRNAWLAQRIHELTEDDRDVLLAVIPVLDRLAEQ